MIPLLLFLAMRSPLLKVSKSGAKTGRGYRSYININMEDIPLALLTDSTLSPEAASSLVVGDALRSSAFAFDAIARSLHSILYARRRAMPIRVYDDEKQFRPIPTLVAFHAYHVVVIST